MLPFQTRQAYQFGNVATRKVVELLAMRYASLKTLKTRRTNASSRHH